MFDLDADLEVDDRAETGLGTPRCSSRRSRFPPCQVRAEAYIKKVDDSIDDTHLQHGLNRHPSAQAQKGQVHSFFFSTCQF